MSREENIKYLRWLIEQVEGVTLKTYQLEIYSDEQLEKEIEFYDYVLEK